MIYLDESGRGNKFYFFGALIADAPAIQDIERGFNEIAGLIAANVAGFDPRTEFHAVDMFQGTSEWKQVPIAWRVKACDLAAKVLARSSARFIFRGVDIEGLERRYANPHPPHLLALAQVLEQADTFLGNEGSAPPIGLAHADEHHSAHSARRSLRDFKIARVPGYTTRQLHRIADTIYFGPSHESRLLQAADVATYFINRARTITEQDPRSSKAVAKIVKNIRSITAHEWVWSPR